MPTPVGPEEEQHAVGAVEAVLQRPLVQHEAARHGVDRLALPDHARAERLLDVAEAVGDLAEHHVLRNARDLRNDLDDVLPVHFPAAVDLRLHRGGVEPADDLVGQLQVPHVAGRHLERGLDRLVLDPDRVVALEARPQVVEDRPRLFDRRLVDLHGAEAARERLVLLDELLVLAQRRRADDPDLAAGQHRLEDVGRVGRRAQRRAGADHRVDFVDEQDQVRALLDLADHVLDAVLEHAAQHRPRDHRVHLQVDDLAVAQPDRDGLGRELDAAREPFGDGGLADAGLAEQQHRVGALAVAEDLEHAVHLGVAAEHRRDLVLARELVQVGREVLEERRQLEALLQPLLVQLVIAHPRGETGDERLRLDAVAADDRHRDALRLLEDRREEVGRLDGVAAAAARVQQRQLEEQLGRRRDAELAAGHARQQAQVLFERLQDFVGIQLEVAHDLPEHVPLGLRERQADVLVREQRVLAAAGLVERAIDDPLGRIGQLVLRNVEIVLFHGALHALIAACLTAIRGPPAEPVDEYGLTV